MAPVAAPGDDDNIVPARASDSNPQEMTMNRPSLVQVALTGTLGLSLATLPVRIVDPVAGLVRVNDACGQATECFHNFNYICSTFHEDWKDYKCSQGCTKEE